MLKVSMGYVIRVSTGENKQNKEEAKLTFKEILAKDFIELMKKYY